MSHLSVYGLLFWSFIFETWILIKDNSESVSLIVFIIGVSFLSENYFFSDPELNDPIPIDFLSHKEQYEQTVRKACIAYRKSHELQKDKEGTDIQRYSIVYIFCVASDIKI